MAIRTDDVIIDDAASSLSMSGTSGNLRLGGAGVDGDVLVFPESGDLTDDSTASVTIDGQQAALRMGGSGTDGDLLLFRSDGDRSDDSTASVTIDGQQAALRMGGSGTDGDILVFPHDGDKTDDATATIHLDGDSGQILFQNGDAAESFEVADPPSASPGTLMVVDDDSRLIVSSTPYDSRVIGVVAGAGSHRAGIVLDHRPGVPGFVPISILGKAACMVDASYGEIRAGDLLTSSETPGHAMRVDMPAAHAFGSVIGKALTPLAEGQALIDILVGLG